jgi:hypothetical protein
MDGSLAAGFVETASLEACRNVPSTPAVASEGLRFSLPALTAISTEPD